MKFIFFFHGCILELKKKAILSAAFILVVLLGLYAILSYDAINNASQLNMEIVGYDIHNNVIVKIHNPTRYTYTIKELRAEYYTDGSMVFKAELEKPVTVGPGKIREATMNVDYSITGILTALFSENDNSHLETYIEIDASLGPIPLGSITLTNFTIGSNNG